MFWHSFLPFRSDADGSTRRSRGRKSKRACRGQNRTCHHRGLALEPLEQRTLLAATPYYVTEGGGSTPHTGLDLAHAWSAAEFNNTANWSATEDAGKIDPGDTVYFSGTFTTALTVQRGGSSSGSITLDGYQGG